MHRGGSEGERKKCYLSKKMKRKGNVGPRGRLGRFGFIPTSRAEYSLLH